LAFSDVPSSHVHGDAILYMQENGIVQGYTDGTFKPESQINRAEFTKIIVGAVTQTISGKNCFPDVKEEWFASYVCTAKSMNIIGGYPDGTFGPTKTITFAEAAKIIVNAFGTPEGAATDGPWYKPFVIKLGAQAAIPTDITDFSQPVTRGAMAEMIFRLKTKNMDKSSRTYEELGGEKSSAPPVQSSVSSEKNEPISKEGQRRKDAYIKTQLALGRANIDDFEYILKDFRAEKLKEITPLLDEYKTYIKSLAAIAEKGTPSEEDREKAGAIIKSANDTFEKLKPMLDEFNKKRCSALEGDYMYDAVYSSQDIMLKLNAQLCPGEIDRIQKCKSIAIQAAASYEGNLHMPETLEAAGCPPNPFWVKP
jgi:hypothetical protein